MSNDFFAKYISKKRHFSQYLIIKDRSSKTHIFIERQKFLRLAMFDAADFVILERHLFKKNIFRRIFFSYYIQH
jgi:hypothetical protein